MRPPDDMEPRGAQDRRPDALGQDDGYFRWRLLRTLGVVAFLLLALLVVALLSFFQLRDIADAVT